MITKFSIGEALFVDLATGNPIGWIEELDEDDNFYNFKIKKLKSAPIFGGKYELYRISKIPVSLIRKIETKNDFDIYLLIANNGKSILADIIKKQYGIDILSGITMLEEVQEKREQLSLKEEVLEAQQRDIEETSQKLVKDMLSLLKDSRKRKQKGSFFADEGLIP